MIKFLVGLFKTPSLDEQLRAKIFKYEGIDIGDAKWTSH